LGFVLTEDQEFISPQLAADQADDTSRQDDKWKRNLEKENRHERQRSKSNNRAAA
jgi:hypothetical protein